MEKMRDCRSKEFKETADIIIADVSNQLLLSINKMHLTLQAKFKVKLKIMISYSS